MSKPIIIQGAMDIELSNIKLMFNNLEKEEYYGYTFYRGSINNYPIILSVTNIGAINSSIATTIGILRYNPLCFINCGVAGGHDYRVHKNDIIIGKECVNINSIETKSRKENEGIDATQWRVKQFISDDLELNDNEKLNSDTKLIKIAKNEFSTYKNGNVFEGALGSGDIWNKEVDRIKDINQKFKTLCEDMESIGTYSACNKFNIPVIGIRAISNNELHNENYDRDVSKELEKRIYNMCKYIIKNLGE